MDRANLAPVAIFTYNRLDNTRKTIEALKKNRYADQTVVYIFSDGGRDEKSWKKVNQLRAYLKTVSGFKQVNIVERPVNFYLEKNIIEGVSSVVRQHGKIIVLEDDVCTGPWYLKYMNDALDFYQHQSEVMHVASQPYLNNLEREDVILTPCMCCTWGWATWLDRWEYFEHYTSREQALQGLTEDDLLKLEYGGNFRCLKTLDWKPIPWDICWYINIYRKKGLCVVPPRVMSKNIGLYSGTHFSTNPIWGRYVLDREFSLHEVKSFNSSLEVDAEYEQKLGDFFAQPMVKYNWLGKVVRYFYLKWKKMF